MVLEQLDLLVLQDGMDSLDNLEALDLWVCFIPKPLYMCKSKIKFGIGVIGYKKYRILILEKKECISKGIVNQY